MKVKLCAEYKKYFTVHELEIAKKVIKNEKEDTCTPEEYAAMAANKIVGHNVDRVVEASATVFKESGNWDRLFDGSENMDIWIDALVLVNYKTIIKLGAYISDIWDEKTEDMYVQKFNLVK